MFFFTVYGIIKYNLFQGGQIMKSKKIVMGILAHVDAGKTTLAEAMLYKTGKLRRAGRVDNGDTLLDTHSLERERGITIFASQAVFSVNSTEITLLDTPGHVDFSAETERTLRALDYAVLVISGLDGVQPHTRTLWKLLGYYNIPTFVFVTKMDFARLTKGELLASLKNELDGNFTDFDSNERDEELAMCRDDLLEKYLAGEKVTDAETAQLIRSRLCFPCLFGSGLKFDGVDEFLDAVDRYTLMPEYPEVFGAKVFKISHDKADRLVHLKVTGGKLSVRDTVKHGTTQSKISQIRIYSGEKYITAESVCAGTVCAVTGLDEIKNGQGLGFEASSSEPVLEPVMNYRIVLPDGCDPQSFMAKLRLLEEEEPLLHVKWNSHLQEIYVGLMGEIQTEILKSLIAERFGIEVNIDSGKVLYKETITQKVEGVGHYEPLRHYAEVHLIMEPLPRGSGLVFESKCSEDNLDRNWQRLILMHLAEKEHLGVLTGSPITDIKITLAAGRAHIKHTEGGDFRQATYRAVRQGLMQAQSKLLEPYYNFRLKVPNEYIGRAINDIRMFSGTFDPPEESDGMSLLKGKAPVITLNPYAAQVASYTGGRGSLVFENAGYDDCHNSEKIIEEAGYFPESDLENTPDSMFCAHGGGFSVKWNKVTEYMHLESCLKKEIPFTPAVNHRNLHIDDKELEAIMEREFGPVKYNLFRPKAREVQQEKHVDFEKKSQCIIVDGYNVIFAWDDLKELAEQSLESARNRLMEILCNYAAFTHYNVIVVFDAYNVAGSQANRFDYHNIHVVFTKERELGDVYIQKLVTEIGKNENVRVVTSDALIQLTSVQAGVLRMSAREFEEEVDSVHAKIGEVLKNIKEKTPKTNIGEIISE